MATAAPASPPRQPPTPTTTALIDPSRDDLKPCREIEKERLGRPVSPVCRWRWIYKGVNGVRLEAIKILNTWYTTDQAFGQFLKAKTVAVLAKEEPAEVATTRPPETSRRLRDAGLLK